MNFKEERPLYRLKEIAAKLRAPDGCPWDRKQDMLSLRKYAIEEAYEVMDAVESGNKETICEELGDLFYQIYAQSQIAEEKGLFNVDDVADAIIKKLIRRHPHVFGDEEISSDDEVSIRWENIKKDEKGSKESLLDGVPRHLPALLKAYRIQEKTSRIGFDWSEIIDVEKKLDEEINEFKEAINKNDSENLFEEFGDILFTLVNLSRFLKIDPEEALQNSNKKFIKRFKSVEEQAREKGKDLNQMTIEEMDKLWKNAKKIIQ